MAIKGTADYAFSNRFQKADYKQTTRVQTYGHTQTAQRYEKDSKAERKVKESELEKLIRLENDPYRIKAEKRRERIQAHLHGQPLPSNKVNNSAKETFTFTLDLSQEANSERMGNLKKKISNL